MREIISGIFGDISRELLVTIIVTGIISLIAIGKKYFSNIILIFTYRKKLGIESIIPSRRRAREKFFKELETSEEIKILNFKGNSLYDNKSSDTTIHKLINNKKVCIMKVLLLNPNSDKYINNRLEEIEEKNDNKEIWADEIKQNIKNLTNLSKNETQHGKKIFCRLFNESLIWCLMFSTEKILVSFYSKNTRADNSFCIVIKRKNNLLGYAFEKYFDDIWNNRSVNAYENER